ncbi:hypothetical protein [Bradyrhizobium pachyrhizi]|nr:hypothetical protein [Bradyrhizobium pachyrhizi]
MAVDRQVSSFDTTRIDAAAGVYLLVNLKIADGVRLMTLQRSAEKS